jgi:hypothetical protein
MSFMLVHVPLFFLNSGSDKSSVLENNQCSYDTTTNGRSHEQMKSKLHVVNHLYIVRPFMGYNVDTDTAVVNAIASVIMVDNCFALLYVACLAFVCLLVVYSYFVTGH